jgi:thiosulfate dehydrogenase
MSRLTWFIFGVVSVVVIAIGGGYLFVTSGGVSLDTAAPPLPFERTLADLALKASYAPSVNQQNPLPLTDANLLAGAQVYKGQQCAMCHGTPGGPQTPIAQGMFPVPPRLFEAADAVTGDPEGVTFWKITHGIRLSGMPGFTKTLSDTERWQLTMLLAHADKLSAAARAALVHPVPHD